MYSLIFEFPQLKINGLLRHLIIPNPEGCRAKVDWRIFEAFFGVLPGNWVL
jgi:hypothetical protein